MRLHRISLLNLNSLYGEQSLDLERDLKGANLFLIHGRTGSGKSTVMDAVALALFGKTPRLDAQRNAPSADPCGIMSRGTGECRAEVEFSRLFSDGTRVRYRAIWSVRRARKKADGGLQPVERSLERLRSNGQWDLLASGKMKTQFNEKLTEVLEGFTVEDFHRSMLLAQGRFDELLSAKPEYRAAILERLTNTAEYATIGSNAAEMARAHKKNVDFLTRRHGDTPTVTELEYQAVHDAAAATHSQAELRAFELRNHRLNLEWWTEKERLRGELGKLDSEKATLNELAEQLAPLLANITEHTRCLTGFVAMARLEASDLRLAQNAGELNVNATLLAAAALGSAETTTHRELADSAMKRAEGLFQNLQVPCATYTAANDNVVAAKVLLDGLQTELADAQSEFANRTNGVIEATAGLELASQNAVQANQRLAACSSTQLVREQWKTQLQESCIRLANQQEKLAKDTFDLSGREQQLLVALNKALERQEECAKHRATLLEVPESIAAMRQARLIELLGANELKNRIRELRSAVELKRHEVDSTLGAQRAILEQEALQADLMQAKVQLAEAEQTATEGAAEATCARQAANLAASKKSEAEKHARRLELVAEIAKRREALSHGEACPLCGSVAHPYLDDPGICPDETTILQALTDTRVEYKLLEKGADEAERLAREAERVADKCKHERDTKQEVCGNIAAKIQAGTEAVVTARKIARLPERCQSDDCAQLLGDQNVQFDVLQNALKDLEAAVEAADDAHQDLTKVRLTIAEEEESLKIELISLEEQKRALQEQLTTLDATRHEIEFGRTSLQAALQQGGVDLTADAAEGVAKLTGPLDWKHLVETKIAVLDSAEIRNTDALRQLREATQRHEAAKESLKTAEGRLQRAQTQEGEQSARCRQLRERAQALLDEIHGLWATRQPHDPLEDELPEGNNSTEILERANRQAEHFREAARKSREAAEAAIREEQRLQGALSALNAARTGLENEGNEARQEFLGVLAQLGFDTAEQLLRHRMQPDMLRDGEAKLDELDRQRQGWKVRHEERLAALERHELSIPVGLVVPDGPEGENLTTTSLDDVGEGGEDTPMPAPKPFETMLAAAVSEAEALLVVAGENERACQIKLADTKRRMAEFATAGEELREAREKASVWLSLDALIGTRNGDAFRQFAQGLNLHRLIQKANIHLQRLSARYLLTQAQDDDVPTLDFAIKDLWQGGQPRSTRTLSGGERFLVSLALALGLSDLRTQSLPIETLVLDEGFGTLDPETLEIALAALQRLHADGRQVGVISHVNGLKERIEAQVRIVEEGAGRSRIEVGRQSPL